MSVDLSKLSSKELFELAKKKEQEELEANQRKGRLQAAIKNREALIARHEETLAASDRAIRELELKRQAQISDFEAVLSPIDKEIAELERQVQESVTRAGATGQSPSPAPASPTPSTKPQPVSTQGQRPAPVTAKLSASGTVSTEELYSQIRNMLLKRAYISESLMKEKLKAAGFDTANLRRQLDQLVQEKRIENKGSGNFALGKRK